MTYTATLELISVLHDALQQHNFPHNWNSASRHRRASQFAADGWVHLIQLTDELEEHDRRIYRISQNIEELCAIFELPVRSVMARPKNHRRNPSTSNAISAIDAAAFIVYMERLGFTIDPVPFVEALRPEASGLKLLSDSEYELLFFEQTRHKSLLRLATEMDAPSKQKKSFATGSGYQVEFELGNDGAVLTVRGSNYKPPKPQMETKCTYCDQTYTQGDWDSTASHRLNHRRKKHSYAPTPDCRLLQLTAHDFSVDRVDQDSPAWMHREVYERAVMFKREMKFDFVQWSSPSSDGRLSEQEVSGVAYLLTVPEEPGTIVGACAFREREVGWTIDWVWIAPDWRRKRVLQRYWPRFVREYGDFPLEHPLSPEMAAFVHKNGTEVQRLEAQRRTQRVEDASPPDGASSGHKASS